LQAEVARWLAWAVEAL
jgi:protein involved in gliding motility GldK